MFDITVLGCWLQIPRRLHATSKSAWPGAIVTVKSKFFSVHLLVQASKDQELRLFGGSSMERKFLLSLQAYKSEESRGEGRRSQAAAGNRV